MDRLLRISLTSVPVLAATLLRVVWTRLTNVLAVAEVMALITPGRFTIVVELTILADRAT
jgi:hypothetical protein